jgi:regulation of enolase protein 1 (concanavalin A-like superfamily)
VKFWQQGAAEPTAWNIQADITPRNGSVILVAYNGDITFGNPSISSGTGGGDVTAPVISNIQASSITASSATISWTTDEASNSVVNYGLTSSYGSNSSNATLATAHSINLTGLSPSTTYHYRVNSTDASNNTASSGDLTFTTSASSGSASGLVSDGFNGALNSSVWTFYDPVGNSTLSTTGTQASISVPAGSNHDLWTSKLFAPRIRQNVITNTDFEVEVKFDSAVTLQYQLQGVTIEADNTNLLRFNFHYDGSTVRAYSASFLNGTATQRFSKAIAGGAPLYLKVTRAGDQWTMSHSYNGTSWTVDGVYTYALSVTKVGLFAGNSGSPIPAHTALVDYFTAR